MLIYHEVTVHEEHAIAHTYYKELLNDLEETGFDKENLFVYHTDETKDNLKKLGLNLAMVEVLI